VHLEALLNANQYYGFMISYASTMCTNGSWVKNSSCKSRAISPSPRIHTSGSNPTSKFQRTTTKINLTSIIEREFQVFNSATSSYNKNYPNHSSLCLQYKIWSSPSWNNKLESQMITTFKINYLVLSRIISNFNNKD